MAQVSTLDKGDLPSYLPFGHHICIFTSLTILANSVQSVSGIGNQTAFTIVFYPGNALLFRALGGVVYSLTLADTTV